MSKPIWVWKLGGSLLELADFPRRLETALTMFQHRPLFVIGGGPVADEVRRWDERYSIGEVKSHELALRAMGLNERLVTTVCPRSVLVANRSAAEAAWRANLVPVLQTREFLAIEELRSETEARHIPQLPHSWDATSDTIAAWIALRWPADGLMLLKSIDRPTNQLGDTVDPSFARFVDRLPSWKWLNLRSVEPSTHGL